MAASLLPRLKNENLFPLKHKKPGFIRDDTLTLDHAICPTLLPTQRTQMCALFRKHEGNKTKACAEFAQAVRDGLVEHKSNLNKVTKEQYALALWYDGAKKGWLR